MARSSPVYDRIGVSYGATRKADPRIALAISTALGAVRHVLNVGAGTGSYEPTHCLVVAVEPSAVMAAQRPQGAAPCVIASAEALPFLDAAVDATLCVLTIHHWSNLAAGIAELRRVAQRRVVILAWDPEVAARFWLVDRYFPEVRVVDEARAPSLARLAELLPGARFETVPVAHDCEDGFTGAFWRRPEAYLESRVRAGMSCFRALETSVIERGLTHLRAELADGTWRRMFGHLVEREQLDLGYRLVVWERG
jgi:SAM-dependent methyltransferase